MQASPPHFIFYMGEVHAGSQTDLVHDAQPILCSTEVQTSNAETDAVVQASPCCSDTGIHTMYSDCPALSRAVDASAQDAASIKKRAVRWIDLVEGADDVSDDDVRAGLAEAGVVSPEATRQSFTAADAAADGEVVLEGKGSNDEVLTVEAFVTEQGEQANGPNCELYTSEQANSTALFEPGFLQTNRPIVPEQVHSSIDPSIVPDQPSNKQGGSMSSNNRSSNKAHQPSQPDLSKLRNYMDSVTYTFDDSTWLRS